MAEPQYNRPSGGVQKSNKVQESDMEENNVRPASAKNVKTTTNEMSPGGSVHESSTEGSEKKEYSAAGWWNPLILNRWTLAGFTLVISMMLIALGLLYHFSELDNGLSTQVSTNHYSWKYGPTALLVIVLSLWRQVDNECKILAPWHEMRRGPSTPAKTLFLDYISPMLPKSLIASIRNKHWAVVASIAGFLFIKLLIVFSTGLLVLESTIMTNRNVPFVATTGFDASNFSASGISVEPAQTYYGIHEENLPYPGHTSDNMVIQDFQPINKDWTNKTIIANVTGFKTTLDCEEVNITTPIGGYWPWIELNTPIYVADIITPSCKIHNFTLGVGPLYGDYFIMDGATETYEGSYKNYTCNENYSNTEYERPAHAPTADTRLVLSMAHLTWPKDTNLTNLSDDQVNVDAYTVLLCKASYSLDTYEVTYSDNESGEVEVSIGAAMEDPKNLTGLYGQDLITAVYASCDSVDNAFGTGGEDAVLWGVNPFFELMSKINNGSRQESFMDAAVLEEYGTKAFEGIMTQIAKDYLTVNKNDTISGSVQFVEDRLRVKRTTVILMGVVLGLLFLDSLLVLFLRSHNVVFTRSDHVGGIATILRKSHKLQKVLSGFGYSRLSAVRHHTSNMHFQTIQTQDSPGAGHNFYIDVVESTEVSLEEPPKKNPEMKWWLPMGMKFPIKLTVILVPLIAIAALEVVQQLSDKYHGFAAISANSSVDPELLISYIPAVIMLIISTLYTTLDFAVGAFAPYYALKKGNSPAVKSININILNRIPPHALYIALKSGYWAACFTIIAGFLSSFLSIIVSGLYTIEAVPTSTDILVQQADRFLLTQGDLSADDKEAGITTSLLYYENLQYPQWTYDDLVFPEIYIPNSAEAMLQNSSETSNDVNATLTVTIPALRASLNCTTVSETFFPSVFFEKNGVYIGEFYIAPGSAYAEYNVPVPWTCNKDVNITTTNFTTYMQWPVANSKVYFAEAGVLEWSADDVGMEVSMDGTTTLDGSISVGGAGCASIGLLLGSETSIRENLGNETLYRLDQVNNTFAMCYQYIEQVNTNVTFMLPDLTIDTSNPPITIESTATYLQNSTNSATWQFPISVLFNSLRSQTDTGNNTISPFIQTLIYGEGGTPLSEFEAEGGMNKLFSASSKLFGKYMAQAINLNMRNTSTSDGQALATWSGVVMDPFTQRIRQNRVSKLVLQIVLGVMAVCGAIAYLAMRSKALLPNNPSSIVGVAKLLAGSDMCAPHDNTIRSGEGKGDYDGCFFGLGWWEAKEAGSTKPGERRRFGIDIGWAEKASEKESEKRSS